VHTIYLGLHTYIPNGGRSRLEIEMEFHEGAVSLSTLLAVYRYRLAHSLSSARSFLYYLLALIFSRANGAKFYEDRVSDNVPSRWRFVNHLHEAEGNLFVSGSSINDRRNCCVRE